MKDTCRKKMASLTYEQFKAQDYLTSIELNREEKRLLFSLRSNCYPAKIYFKNMNKGNLKCSLNCDQIETQIHIFENCEPVLSRLNTTETTTLNSIYGSITEQKSAVKVFLKIDNMRRKMINNLLPGEEDARTQDN